MADFGFQMKRKENNYFVLKCAKVEANMCVCVTVCVCGGIEINSTNKQMSCGNYKLRLSARAAQQDQPH